jgi:hypothetical protein
MPEPQKKPSEDEEIDGAIRFIADAEAGMVHRAERLLQIIDKEGGAVNERRDTALEALAFATVVQGFTLYQIRNVLYKAYGDPDAAPGTPESEGTVKKDQGKS